MSALEKRLQVLLDQERFRRLERVGRDGALGRFDRAIGDRPALCLDERRRHPLGRRAARARGDLGDGGAGDEE